MISLIEDLEAKYSRRQKIRQAFDLFLTSDATMPIRTIAREVGIHETTISSVRNHDGWDAALASLREQKKRQAETDQSPISPSARYLQQARCLRAAQVQLAEQATALAEAAMSQVGEFDGAGKFVALRTGATAKDVVAAISAARASWQHAADVCGERVREKEAAQKVKAAPVAVTFNLPVPKRAREVEGKVMEV